MKISDEKEAPGGLLCELMEHPELSRIQSERPRFGWIVNHPVPGDGQTAYQVLVAASEENIGNNTGDRWDSGKVVSCESINVRYNGRPLESNATYYWKVRTWNSRDEADPYSEPQTFRTGDLNPEYSTARYPLLKQEIAPARIVKKEGGAVFIDFGRAMFGTLRMTFIRPLADRRAFEIHLGELLAGPDEIERKPPSRYMRYFKADVVLEKGKSDFVLDLPEIDKRGLPPETGGGACRFGVARSSRHRRNWIRPG